MAGSSLRWAAEVETSDGTASPAGPHAVRASRLERQLARVRWFGAALAFYEVWGSYRAAGDPAVPSHVRPLGYGIAASLLVVNVLVLLWLRTRPSEGRVRRVGWFVFAADAAAIIGLTWLYSFDRNVTTWVTLYVLPLEGALRAQLRGAMVAVAVALPTEVARDVFRELAYDFPFTAAGPMFRVGIMAIIGAVAGLMGRQLERERAHAEERARELEAFQTVVLAGAEGTTMKDTAERIVQPMAVGLGYETLSVGLVDDEGGTPVVRCVSAYGFPSGALGTFLSVGRGVVGRAVAQGRPQLVSDTRDDPDYVEFLPGARSEMVVPIFGREGVIGVVNVESREPAAFDRTDLRRLETLAAQIGLIMSNIRLLEKERAAADRLRELDGMKSDFVAIASHELRTPLTAISGFVKTLRRPEVSPTQANIEEFLEVIDRQVDRLTRLVEDLLMVSRIESGRILLRLGPVEVERFIAEVLEGVGEGSDQVRVAVERDMPALVTDGQRLGQILRNLVENAVKFSHPGGAVRVTALRDDGQLVLEVADAGPGIPPEELSQIFERFHQVGGPMNRRSGGVGLGLYITKRLVEALGGSIDVGSEMGSGTTFRVRVPFAPADAAAAG